MKRLLAHGGTLFMCFWLVQFVGVNWVSRCRDCDFLVHVFGMEFLVCRLGISIRFLLDGGEARHMVCIDGGNGDMVA
ncbi:uncharacterized protein HKW66_Vig0033060 [Vigna angularis]|uniref:Uncharacterized protein n=1 Tax=Phaseolus angularis TaxID=3914 RepID=A0A8T0L946_PHAAN|nr:uncharacterized protein HKW66_Vig0033060 [Vigna angularis]